VKSSTFRWSRVLAPLALAASIPVSGWAANRYGNAAYLKPFPASEIPNAYQFSPNAQYHFAVPYASAAVRYAAYQTYREYGAAPVPMTVCDCTTASGDTPAGRHPTGAHDGGINFDITYFMKRLTNGMIVCPLNAGAHCTGPASDLEPQRQAYFFAALAQLDLDTNQQLIKTLAVDYQVEQAVTPYLDQLQAARKFSSTAIAQAKNLVYSEATDLGTGWFAFHYNHVHCRFQWQPTQSDQLAKAIEGRITRFMAANPTRNLQNGHLSFTQDRSQPADGQPSSRQPAGSPTPNGQPVDERPEGSTPATGQPASEQPAPGQPAPGQPAPGQPAGGEKGLEGPG